jgi:hypothetical protein
MNTIDDDETEDAYSELSQYFQTIREILHKVPGILVKVSMQCSNVTNTFRLREVKLLHQDNELTLTILYSVYKANKNHILSSTRECGADALPMDVVFDALWKYVLCPECLDLMPSSMDVCRACQIHKIRQLYGVQKGYITEHATCMICHELVYHTRLQCGHAVHHTCVLNLNDHQWYTPSLSLPCPLCRQPMTEHDKNRFFLCHPPHG